MSKTILLSQEEVMSLITMDDILESVDKTFQGLGDGTVWTWAKLPSSPPIRAS